MITHKGILIQTILYINSILQYQFEITNSSVLPKLICIARDTLQSSLYQYKWALGGLFFYFNPYHLHPPFLKMNIGVKEEKKILRAHNSWKYRLDNYANYILVTL